MAIFQHKIYKENGEALPAIIMQKAVDAPPVGYTQITSVVDLDSYGFKNDGGFDYKAVRDCIKATVQQKGEDTVISTQTDPSTLTPALNDSYLVGPSPLHEWVGRTGRIAIWDGAKWDFEKTEKVGFDTLTSPEKYVCAVHKIGTHAQRLTTVVDVKELAKLGNTYNTKVLEVRRARFNVTMSMMHNYLEHIVEEFPSDNSGLNMVNDPSVLTPNLNDQWIVGYYAVGVWAGREGQVATWNGSSWDFWTRIFLLATEIALNDIDGTNYIWKYIELGLGGLIDGDNAIAMYDYINATPGTQWELIGFRAKSWIPEGLNNMSEFSDLLLDVYQNGNY